MSEKNEFTLCRPDAAQGLCHTNVVCLKLVQADGGGEGECAEEPVAEAAELGHTLGREVIDNSSPVRTKGLDSDSLIQDRAKIWG